ncbi:hypothetical protein BT69DRAFT_44103 [Atractiella rhizophila]|nr:hypothetical protein BT69DRAFT_44103 [Atractiella rhizophila]
MSILCQCWVFFESDRSTHALSLKLVARFPVQDLSDQEMTRKGLAHFLDERCQAYEHLVAVDGASTLQLAQSARTRYFCSLFSPTTLTVPDPQES